MAQANMSAWLIERASLCDLASLHELEQQWVGKGGRTLEGLRDALSVQSRACSAYVLRMNAELQGVLWTQWIRDTAAIADTTWDAVSCLRGLWSPLSWPAPDARTADDAGVVLQLLRLITRKRALQDCGIPVGDVLRQFSLQLASAAGCRTVIAVTTHDAKPFHILAGAT